MNRKQQALIKNYDSLDQTIKEIVQVLAVASESMARTNLVSLASKVGVRHAGGRRPNYKEDRDDLNKAIDLGVIQYVSKSKSGPVEVNQLIADYVFQDVFHRELFKSILRNFDEQNSRYSQRRYYHHDPGMSIREMRAAFYKGDLKKWNEFQERYDFRPVVLDPFCADSFERLIPEFQSLYFGWVSHDIVALNLPNDRLDFVEPFVNSFSKLPNDVVESAVDLYSAQGNLDALRQLDKHLAEPRSEIKACIAFLQGDYVAAREYFETAVKEHCKRTKKRKPEFKHMPSLFYGLLLLKENSPQSQKQLRQLAKTCSDWKNAYRMLSRPLDAAIARQTAPLKNPLPLLYGKNEIHAIGFLVSGLTWCWLYADKKATFDQSHFQELIDNYRKSGLDWLAAEFSAITSRSMTKKDADQLTKFSDATHRELGTVSLVDFIDPVPAWDVALTALEHICNSGSSGSKTVKPTEALRDERMIWELEYSPGGSSIYLHPHIQKLGQKGWSKGRKVALSRLYEQWESSGFDFLTDQDQAICRCLKQSYEINPYGYRERVYEWNQRKLCKSLFGHPNLYQTGSRDTPIEVTESKPHLSIEQSQQKIKLLIQPSAKGQSRFIQQEGSHRISIVEFSDKQKQVAELISELPAVPSKQQDRVSEIARSISSIIDVQSDVEGTPSSGETVAANGNIIVQLTPYQEGLRAELFTQPLGEKGPFCRPGIGAAAVFATVDGNSLTATRDLELERSNLQQVIGDCHPLDARTINNEQTEWLFHESEDALELVMELQALADQNKLTVLWPRGKTHDVAGIASSSSLQVSVRRDRDWFAASGKLAVDDDLTVDMMKLLDLVANSPSRFVQLDDGRFLALTQELRQRIADIAAFGNAMKNKIRIAPIRALAVDELLEDANSKTDKHWKAHLGRIEESAALDTTPPSTLQTDLRDYQIEGYGWLKRLAHWNTGACLADDMGLGKTIQALALLIERAPAGPALVVAPATVGFNWESETRKFAPTLTPKSFRDCDRDKFFEDLQPGDLVIASYGLLQSEIERFAAVHWCTILLDEAQAIKNMETKRSQAAMRLEGDFRMILTGTPLENHLGEMWNLFRFIAPGLLGSNADFRQRFAIPIERDQCRESRNRLKKLIQPFLLRRTKTEVLSELPPRSESILEVELSPAEVALYEAIRLQALEKISESADGKKQGERHLQVLAELTRLRLACCHPSLVGGEGIESSKLELFHDKVREIVYGNHKVLVFSQFVKHLSILRGELDSMGISYQYLDGSTPVKKRQQIVESFQAGDGDVFLISLKAGGTGLNLTAADYVIHMDPWWNPAVEDQATDRAHRIGQNRPVNVYRLITKGTIEEKIVELHNSKRDLADNLLSGSNIASKLTTNDLIDLLKQNAKVAELA